MARIICLFAVTILALSKVNGDGLLDEIKEDMQKAAEYVEEQASKAKASLKHVADDVSGVRTDFKNKVSRIEAVFDKALGIVESSQEECKGNAKNNLLLLKSGSVGSFLTCSKIIEAGKDVVDIVITTGDIAFDIIDITKDVMSGFSGCLTSLWPWKIVGCWWDRVSTTYDDIKRTISDISNYASTIDGYAHNASVLIKYCWDGNTIESDILQAITPLYQCSSQEIPQNIYKP